MSMTVTLLFYFEIVEVRQYRKIQFYLQLYLIFSCRPFNVLFEHT